MSPWLGMSDWPYSAPTPLTSERDLAAFDCGISSLNDFLKRYAVSNQAGGSARTFVTVDRGERVVGYYSLAAAAVLHENAPDRVKLGQPHHPIPAILMARLAVDRSAQGKGLGARLFRDALLRSLNVTDDLGVRAFAVDAKDDDARRFYLKFNMMFVPDYPYKLFLLMKDIRKLLAE